MKIYTVIFFYEDSRGITESKVFSTEFMKSFTTYEKAVEYSDQFNAEEFDGCEIIESELDEVE